MRQAARTALLTIFQGMWSRFSPNNVLTMKVPKPHGRPRKFGKYAGQDFLYEYEALGTVFNEIRDSDVAGTQLKKGEDRDQFVRRMAEVVQQLHRSTDYGMDTEEAAPDIIGKIIWNRLPEKTANDIAAKAIPEKGLRRDRLLAGLLAHYHMGSPTKWKAMKRLIENTQNNS